MSDECYCTVNAYALKGMCECKTICLCDCEGCDCKKNRIDIWAADSNVSVVCDCNGNCNCGVYDVVEDEDV